MKKLNLLLLYMLTGIFPLLSQNPHFPRISMEGVELMGAIKHGTLDHNLGTSLPKGVYFFNYANNYQIQKNEPAIIFKVSGGSTYHKGKIYACEYDYNSNLTTQNPRWKVFDASSHEQLVDAEMADSCRSTIYNMAYDRTSDLIYGFLETYTEYHFVKIDPVTAQVERICQLPYNNKYTCIACDKEGQLYCIYFKKDDKTHYFAKIRKSDGRMGNVGVMKVNHLLPGDTFVNGGYSQALFFNNSTDKLYWMLQSSTLNLPYKEYTPIFEVETKTGVANLLAYVIEPLMITGAYFQEPALTAPGIIDNFKHIATSEDRTNGQLSFLLPQNDYANKPLKGDLSVVVTEQAKIIYEGTALAGATVNTGTIRFSQGEHHVGITVINSQGERGPTVMRSFYSGYDIPKACRNIALKAEGLKTILTWDNPQTGIHGASIDTTEMTYTVIRYPHEVTVATQLKERTFIENHPEDMTRYVYLVKAVDRQGREGKPAFSNNLIVGKPLDTPFNCTFNNPADLLNYYTIVDANGDQFSWRYDTDMQCPFYKNNERGNADDWFITPPINFKKGHQYRLNFKAWASHAGSASMEVKYGKGRTPETLDKLLLSISDVPTNSCADSLLTHRLLFTTDNDSVFHIGFHVTSNAGHGILRVDDIGISEETAGVHILNCNTASDEVAVYDLNGVLLHWAAPSSIIKMLEPGIYIIRSSAGWQKIAIKQPAR